MSIFDVFGGHHILKKLGASDKEVSDAKNFINAIGNEINRHWDLMREAYTGLVMTDADALTPTARKEHWNNMENLADKAEAVFNDVAKKHPVYFPLNVNAEKNKFEYIRGELCERDTRKPVVTTTKDKKIFIGEQETNLVDLGGRLYEKGQEGTLREVVGRRLDMASITLIAKSSIFVNIWSFVTKGRLCTPEENKNIIQEACNERCANIKKDLSIEPEKKLKLIASIESLRDMRLNDYDNAMERAKYKAQLQAERENTPPRSSLTLFWDKNVSSPRPVPKVFDREFINAFKKISPNRPGIDQAVLERKHPLYDVKQTSSGDLTLCHHKYPDSPFLTMTNDGIVLDPHAIKKADLSDTELARIMVAAVYATGRDPSKQIGVLLQGGDSKLAMAVTEVLQSQQFKIIDSSYKMDNTNIQIGYTGPEPKGPRY